MRLGNRWLRGILLLLVMAPPAAAKDVLLFLEYMDRDKRVSWEITDKPGPINAPVKNRSEVAWHVRQGTPTSGATPPRPRRVDFYQGMGAQRQLICALEVRYFPDGKSGKNDKWRPHYRLYEEVLFVRDRHLWRPLDTVDGVPLLVEHRSPSLPNAEGYYPELDFDLTVGRLGIDLWQVVDTTISPFSSNP